ncbi:MAG: GNAT family N-acetyltransferase [Christensenellales bacterium]|jgi:diamine N-acetyltransferase
MVQLDRVTKANIDAVLGLRVKESQKNYVSSTAVSLAQAYVSPETAFPFAVCNDGDVVGFLMMGYYEEKGYYTIWKLLIDEKYQGRGYGKKALELGVRYLRERFQVTKVYTGVLPENDVAKSLYKSVGFMETGLFENGMEELCLRL